MMFKNPACKNIYCSFNLFGALIYAPKLKSKSFLFYWLSAKNVIQFICICLSYVCSLNKLLYFHIFCSYCKYLTLHINLEMICLSVCLFSFLRLLMLSLNTLDTGNWPVITNSNSVLRYTLATLRFNNSCIRYYFLEQIYNFIYQNKLQQQQ